MVSGPEFVLLPAPNIPSIRDTCRQRSEVEGTLPPASASHFRISVEALKFVKSIWNKPHNKKYSNNMTICNNNFLVLNVLNVGNEGMIHNHSIIIPATPIPIHSLLSTSSTKNDNELGRIRTISWFSRYLRPAKIETMSASIVICWSMLTWSVK